MTSSGGERSWYAPNKELWAEAYLGIQKLAVVAVYAICHQGLSYFLERSGIGHDFPIVERILRGIAALAFGIIEARLLLDVVITFVLLPLPTRWTNRPK